jgi:hypothetical protein
MVKNMFVTGRTNERVDGLIVVPLGFLTVFSHQLASCAMALSWYVGFILPGNYMLLQLEGNRRSHGWWTMKFNGVTPGHR